MMKINTYDMARKVLRVECLRRSAFRNDYRGGLTTGEESLQT
jgi:hypothetical protein